MIGLYLQMKIPSANKSANLTLFVGYFKRLHIKIQKCRSVIGSYQERLEVEYETKRN